MWSSWMPDYGGSIVVKPIFKEKPPLASKQDLCCVIMPFREPYEDIFNQTVRPSLENIGFTVVKADSIFFKEMERDQASVSGGGPTAALSREAPTLALSRDASVASAVPRFFETRPRVISVMERIWILINKSRLLVADLTDKNANVFYELGIAHTIGKDVIIISQKEEDIPFDIRHLPYIIYTNDQDGQKKLKQDLENVAKEIRPEVNYPSYWWPGYWWPDLNIKNLWPV